MRLPFLLAAGFCLATACPLAPASELRTPTYVVRITEHCPEGEVGCQDVTYVGTHKGSGKSITLKGKSVMHMCADRVTPCSHEGYAFRSGNVEYRVTQAGWLVVSQGGKVLVKEQGQWQP